MEGALEDTAGQQHSRADTQNDFLQSLRTSKITFDIFSIKVAQEGTFFYVP